MINLLYAEIFDKTVKLILFFLKIFFHTEMAQAVQNLSHRRTVNTMAADDLVIKGALGCNELITQFPSLRDWLNK